MRVLALDYGSARCGCALSDPTGTIVTPLEAVERPGDQARACDARAARPRARGRAGRRRAAALARGGDTDQTRETRAFAGALAAPGRGVPVELHDERFTTRIAQRDAGIASGQRGLARGRPPARELAGGPIALGSLVLARGDRSRQGRERTAEERERDRGSANAAAPERTGGPASHPSPRPGRLPPAEPTARTRGRVRAGPAARPCARASADRRARAGSAVRSPESSLTDEPAPAPPVEPEPEPQPAEPVADSAVRFARVTADRRARRRAPPLKPSRRAEPAVRRRAAACGACGRGGVRAEAGARAATACSAGLHGVPAGRLRNQPHEPAAEPCSCVGGAGASGASRRAAPPSSPSAAEPSAEPALGRCAEQRPAERRSRARRMRGRGAGRLPPAPGASGRRRRLRTPEGARAEALRDPRGRRIGALARARRCGARRGAAAVCAAAQVEREARPPAAPATVKVLIPEGKTRLQIAQIAAAGRPARQLPGGVAALAAARPGPLRRARTARRTSKASCSRPPTTSSTGALGEPARAANSWSRSRKTSAPALDARARALHVTPYQLLIVASMVEREAQVPSDRAKIAAVIYNRLRAGMPLGIDATIYYAIELKSGIADLHARTHRSAAAHRTRRTTRALHTRPAADADLQPGPRLDRSRRASGARALPLLRRSAPTAAASTCSRPRSPTSKPTRPPTTKRSAKNGGHPPTCKK